MGIVADLLNATFFVFTALALYLLLNDVHKSAASPGRIALPSSHGKSTL